MVAFPLVNPIYKPSIREIAAISSIQVQNQLALQITTTQDHLYKDGLVVRLNIPLEYQAYQLNDLFSDIAVTGTTTFVMAFTNNGGLQFDPFVVPASPQQAALVIPIAEDVQFLDSAVFNRLP